MPEFDHNTDIDSLQAQLGHRFERPELLVRALTHRSYANEASDADGNNQRLEFLGDSVLGLVIACELFSRFETVQEGALSGALSRLVCEPALYTIAQKLDLGAYIRLGRGEAKSGGREKAGVLADAYEAILAAVFLDGGLEAARVVILDLHGDALDGIEPEPTATDAKSRLQKIVQADTGDTPTYRILDERGPAHERIFLAVVEVDGRSLGQAEGRSKKDAERRAAQMALSVLESEAD